jgi:ABC-type maltose transport system permease subunit
MNVRPLYSIYLLVGYLTTISISLAKSAILDSTSRFKIAIFVILPLVYSGFVATTT